MSGDKAEGGQEQQLNELPLPLNVYQVIARHLDIKDVAYLALVSKATRDTISKVPKYAGAKARAAFFVKVGQQKELLFQQARAQGDFLSSLAKGTDEEKAQHYRELLRIFQHDLNFQPTSQDINALKIKMQNEHCDLLPLLAALKLEIIKTKPAESEYFLNIHNEQTQFDYQEGYSAIVFFTVVGVAALMIAAAPLVGSLILGSALLGAMLPYIITASVVGIVSLSIAAGSGDQHQRGLHEFVLDDAFLSSNIVTLSK